MLTMFSLLWIRLRWSGRTRRCQVYELKKKVISSAPEDVDEPDN